MSDPVTYCPKSGKIMYISRADAEVQRTRTYERKLGRQVRPSIYFCKDCQSWHFGRRMDKAWR